MRRPLGFLPSFPRWHASITAAATHSHHCPDTDVSPLPRAPTRLSACTSVPTGPVLAALPRSYLKLSSSLPPVPTVWPPFHVPPSGKRQSACLCPPPSLPLPSTCSVTEDSFLNPFLFSLSPFQFQTKNSCLKLDEKFLMGHSASTLPPISPDL